MLVENWALPGKKRCDPAELGSARERAPRQTYGYQERDEEKRRQFEEKLKSVENNGIVYVDEAGFDNREDYPYGYSPRGERCYDLKDGKRKERVSWIAALREKALFAPLTFEGCCSRDLFETWLKECLRPQLKPGDIIIIDNASFHKGETIEKIVKEAGCELWYLPTYSPDLNKRWEPASAKAVGTRGILPLKARRMATRKGMPTEQGKAHQEK